MKKGLGKGLEALITSANSLEESQKSVTEIKINEIDPNSDQPRKVFDEERLRALSESIREHGVVQPIIVKNHGKRFMIIAGERRWRAAKMAGFKTIPAIVKELSTREVMEIALIENLQREDLNPVEEAEAFQRLMEEFGMTQEDVAKVVGKSRASVANSVRLLHLPDEIKDMLSDGRLSSGHARSLVTITDAGRQRELADHIVEKSLNVRDTEKLISNEEKKKAVKPKAKTKNNIQINDIEERLRTLYGTKVDLIRGRDKGKIVFEFYSNEECERLLEILVSVENK